MKSASEIAGEARELSKSLETSRLVTAAVLANYHGKGGMLTGGSTYAQGLDVTLPSAKLRALESLTHTNAMGSVIDTALSQLVRTPNWRVNTVGAHWSKQRTCRKVEQWIAGSLTSAGVSDVKWQVCADSATTPVAGARVWMEADGLHVARVRPDYIVYNPREGKTPRNLWLVYPVPIESLKKRYPKHAKAVEKGDKWAPNSIYDQLDVMCDVEANQVEVIEHWQLGENGKPGEHSIVCGGEVLNEAEGREWKYKFHGLVELTWKPGWDSFGGQSLGAQLLPYQVTLNRMNRVIDTAQAKMSIARILLPKGSEVEKAQFSRSVGEFIDFNPAGGQPVIRPAQAISPEYYDRLRDIVSTMYQMAGVSESQAHGTIPAGMAGASGKALAQVDDKAATRLKAQADRIDRWDERLATVAVAVAKDWFTSGGGTDKRKVKAAPGSAVLEEVDWKEVDLSEDDGITIRCKSISDLPNHPGARLDYLERMVKSGIINPRYAAKLLAVSDSEAWEDIQTAAFDTATAHIEAVLYDAKPVSPEPNQEYLEILSDIGTRELLKAVRLGAPDENVELLRRLLEVAAYQLKKLGGAAPANDLSAGGQPAMAPPGSPLAAGMAPAQEVPQAAQPIAAAAGRWA